jgi:Fe2+ or Zn2+ uptake regulation protein
VHRHDHVHVKCTECDRVECRDLPVELAQGLQNLALAELNISAKGLCIFCAA